MANTLVEKQSLRETSCGRADGCCIVVTTPMLSEGFRAVEQTCPCSSNQ